MGGMPASLEDLGRKLRQVRDVGENWVAGLDRRGLGDAEAVEALTASVGLIVPHHLSRIPRDVAVDMIVEFLATSLAYSRYDAMPRADAVSIATDFVAHFAENATFMTNMGMITSSGPTVIIRTGPTPDRRRRFSVRSVIRPLATPPFAVPD